MREWIIIGIICIVLFFLMQVVINRRETTSQKSEEGKPDSLVIDLNGTWILMGGDSIWWKQPEHIIDSVVVSESGLSFMHSHSAPPLDTVIGLKGAKPVVLIVDGDTTKHWFFGDTVRINRFMPINPNPTFFSAFKTVL